MHTSRARVPVLVIAFILTSLGIGAQVPASLRMDNRDLHGLAIRAGTVLPTASFPYTAATIIPILERLNLESAEDGQPAGAEHLLALANFDLPLVDVAFDTCYEQYFRPPHQLDLREMLVKIDPLAILTFSYQHDLSTVFYINALLQREYGPYDLGNNAFTSATGNPIALENNNVRAGYLYLHHETAEIIIGRQDIRIGPSPLTSLVVAPDVPFLDAATFRLDLGSLRMTMIVSTLENREAASDVPIIPPTSDAFGSTIILHNIHYFEYDFGFLRLGVGGQIIITRPGNAFQAADFFPVFSWHQANILPNNLTLTLDASWVPFPGLELYMQYGFDDINTTGIGSNDASIPTIPAGLVGASLSIFQHRLAMDITAEAGYTHYLWGMYETESPLSRAIYRMNLDGNNQWIPLNSPFGPGTIWILLDVMLESPWRLSAQFTTRLLWRKAGVDLAITPYSADPFLQNAPFAFSLHSGLVVAYEPFPWLRLTLEPELFFEEGEAWFELGIGANTHVEARGQVR